MYQLSSMEIGAIAEMKFCNAAIQLGFMPSMPVVNSSNYDILLDNKHGGFFRVQVKSTAAKARDGSYSIRVSKGNDRLQQYKKEDIDFFAIYLYALDVFYIIPFEEITVKVKLTLNPNNREHKLNIYRENWSYFSPKSLSSTQSSQTIDPSDNS